MVFYTWGKDGAHAKYDPDFNQQIDWDIPLLDGYNHKFVENTAKDKGSHHFKGIINPTLINKIKNFNPDAILVYGWAYQSHLKALCYFKGKISIWFRGDSTLLSDRNKLKKVIRFLFLKWLYKHIDKAFYVGTANKAYFLKYGLKPSQLIFAPHAIDNERFAKKKVDEANALRASLHIQKEDILILFAGKLEPKKNPELLLNAFIEIKKESEDRSRKSEANDKSPSPLGDVRRPGVHLLFVGNGVLEESLKLKVESLRFKNIHFLDFQNQKQMPIIYQACDLFVLPSRSETWGLAVNEAMACGKAILVSNKVGCADDLVVAGKNGNIFSTENDLIKQLKNLTQSKFNLIKMGLCSKEVVKNWSFEKQCTAIIKALENG